MFLSSPEIWAKGEDNVSEEGTFSEGEADDEDKLSCDDNVDDDERDEEEESPRRDTLHPLQPDLDRALCRFLCEVFLQSSSAPRAWWDLDLPI